MTATAPDAATAATLAVVRRFNEESFQRHDVDALMADMTDDCVFELVAPAEKGGGRWEGQAAVRAFWASLEDAFPGYASELEDVFACGDRCACRRTLRGDLPGGGRGSLRGADVLTIRDGKIAVKLTYLPT